MNAEQWSEWEASVEEDETMRRDLVRIRGYALACASDAVNARDLVTKAVDSAQRAQKKAAFELSRCNQVCILAERAALFAARAMAGDVEPYVRREVAAQLEELFG